LKTPLHSHLEPKDNFWQSGSAGYAAVESESRKQLLHPTIAGLIGQDAGVRVLDYGCGDGSLARLLNKECELGLFDISENMLLLAEQHLKDYAPVIYRDPGAIPHDYYDYVVFSLVLMTISTKEEIKKTLSIIRSALKANGTAIIAITHPCFRQQRFSTFRTAYTQGKEFNYFREGEPFEVLIRDEGTAHEVRFHDYHWTLGTTIDLLAQSGLPLARLIELPDLPARPGGYANVLASPYIILECKDAD
jgi:SAM-dependent methyltransferase